jgi:site-specific DNA-methyltransferase (cytosine-N4-specific)
MVQTPWMVAMALQADGWYLRSDIIWSKPNPMPESVTDRPTKAHEYLFLLTKSERYYYDADAIKEPSTWQRANNPEWAKQRAETNAKKGCGNRNAQSAGFTEWDAKNGRNKRSVWTVPYEGQATKDYDSAGAQNPSDTKRRVLESMADPDYAGANKKSVWTVNTMPYSGAHFATMPEKLVEPCILAGCPMGGLVCDPFVGSGTVVSVAQRLGRRGVGVDLSYQDLARKRTAQRGLMFALPDGGGLSQP